MKKLYKYQENTIKEVFSFFSDRPSGMMLVVAPTGTGKSVIQLAILSLIKGAVVHIITTKITIIRGYLRILGYEVEGKSDNALKRIAKDHGIYTYATYRNRLLDGDVQVPDVLLIDEAHHVMETNKLSSQILYYRAKMKVIGFTATPYRATARATKDFIAIWDYVYTAITIKEALAQGIWTLPTFRTIGTIDDDALSVRNGEFVITSLSSLDKCVKGTLFETILETLKSYNEKRAVVEVPNTEIAYALCDYLNAMGWQSNCLTHKTKAKDRVEILQALEEGTHTLVEVSILSEGFDLPDLPLVIDANPKFSPVRFMQLLGRLTRKSLVEKTYVCLCRNIERHGYLLEGVLPSSVVKESQEAFGMPSTRGSRRVFGEDRLGKLKAIPFLTTSGVWGSFYLVTSFEAPIKRSFAILLMPNSSEFIVAEHIVKYVDGVWGKARWKLSQIPDDFSGYNTQKINNKELTSRQKWRWENDCERYGLAKRVGINSRELQILFILKDLGVKVG